MRSETTSFKIKIPHPIKDERYKEASLSKIQDLTTEQAEKLKAWIYDPKHFLFLHSDYGVGKTYIASAIANFFYANYVPTYFFNEHELYAMLKSEETDSRCAYGKLKSICDNDIVVWDDFGSTMQNGKNDFNENAKKNFMFQFIDDRYNSKKPTIITTNFSVSQLAEIVNHRIASRINAKENLIIELFGEDKRQLGL